MRFVFCIFQFEFSKIKSHFGMMLPKAGCDPRIRQQILEDIEKLDDYQRIESKRIFL